MSYSLPQHLVSQIHWPIVWQALVTDTVSQGACDLAKVKHLVSIVL